MPTATATATISPPANLLRPKNLPSRPTKSDTPPGNFQMLSQLNELDLRGLFLTEQQSRSGQHSGKKSPHKASLFSRERILKLPGGVSIFVGRQGIFSFRCFQTTCEQICYVRVFFLIRGRFSEIHADIYTYLKKKWHTRNTESLNVRIWQHQYQKISTTKNNNKFLLKNIFHDSHVPCHFSKTPTARVTSPAPTNSIPHYAPYACLEGPKNALFPFSFFLFNLQQ